MRDSVRMQLPAMTLAVLTSMAAACSAAGSSTPVAGNPDGIEIISDSRHYPTESGRHYYRTTRLRVRGRSVDAEEMSRSLFPNEHDVCASPFYTIRDIRLLQDGSALALFSKSEDEARCGKAQLARLSVAGSRLKTTRIDLSDVIDGTPSVRSRRAGVDTIVFGSPRGGYGYVNTEVELRAQMDTSGTWVIVPLRHAQAEDESSVPPRETIAIDLRDLGAHSLGSGEIISFMENESIALMSVRDTGDPKDASVQFKAIRLTDGKLLDSEIFPLRRYSITGDLAISALQSRLAASKAASAAESAAAEHHYQQTLNQDKAITDQKLKDEFNFSEILATMKAHRDSTQADDTAIQSTTLEAIAKGEALHGRTLQNVHDAVVADVLLEAADQVGWDAEHRRLKVPEPHEITLRP